MGEIRNRIKASKKVRASLLPASDLFTRLWGPTSLFCSLMRLVGGLLQGLCQAQDPRAIIIKI